MFILFGKYKVLLTLLALLASQAIYAEQKTMSSKINFSLGASQQTSNDDYLLDLSSNGYEGFQVANSENSFSFDISYQRKLWGSIFGEIGYVNLGSNDIELELAVPSEKAPSDIAGDIYESTSLRGHGIIAGIGYERPISKHLNWSISAGGYFWKSDSTVSISGFEYKYTDSSTNAYVKTSLSYLIKPNLSLIGSLEHFDLPKQPVNYIGLGLGIGF